MTHPLTAEVMKMKRPNGHFEVCWDIAHERGLSAQSFRELERDVRNAIDEIYREKFRAYVARGGMRHVGNSGRV